MGGSETKYVMEAFESNYVAPIGPQLARFEEDYCKLTGFGHCVAVASGTAAMHLALRNLGVGPGDIVLASTLTFIGSVSPVWFQGAETVFIDSCFETWNMDPQLLSDEIQSMASQGRLPKAVIPTDLYGQSCDLKTIVEICDAHGIPVICDCAESLGATHRGQSTGKGAKAAVSSFNGNKILTTSGGGILASDDKSMIDQARYLATQARLNYAHYEHETIGYNYRMSNIVAAVGIGQLEVLRLRVQQKRQINAWYKQELSGMPGISFMPSATYGEENCWLTVIQIDSAELGVTPLEIMAALEKENIESRPVWKPMHCQPAYASSRIRGGHVAEQLYANGLCLPSGTAMDRSTVNDICEVIRVSVTDARLK
jgi:dTDP-4-amino-4,6-dideoxygalactose transaminase